MKEFVKAILILILFLIPFQDLINSVFFKVGLPSLYVLFFGVLKEILVVLLGAALIIRNKGRIPKRISFFYLLFGYVVILFLVSSLPFDVKVGGLRQYLLLFFSLVAGYFIEFDTWHELISSRTFGIVLTLFVTFCFLQHFVLPLSIFKDYFPILEMKREALNLQTGNEHLDTGLPINYMGEAGPRMLGPFGEPLYTGYFALPFFNYNLWAYFMSRKRSRLYIAILFFLIIMLSQTRAVIIVSLLYFFLCIWRKLDFRVLIYFVIGAILLIFFNSGWIRSLSESLLTTEGRSADHYLSYVIGIKLMFSNLWGTGLGSGSVIATFLNDNSAVSLSVENAFINISLDLGIFVTLLLLFSLIRNYLRGEKVRRLLHISVPSPYNILALQFLIMGFLAPHILTIRMLIPYMIIIGLAVKTTQNEDLYYNNFNHG